VGRPTAGRRRAQVAVEEAALGFGWSRRPVEQGRWRGQETGSGEVIFDGSGGGEPMAGGSGGTAAGAGRDESAGGEAPGLVRKGGEGDHGGRRVDGTASPPAAGGVGGWRRPLFFYPPLPHRLP
jgi:hypothetical protein